MQGTVTLAYPSEPACSSRSQLPPFVVSGGSQTASGGHAATVQYLTTGGIVVANPASCLRQVDLTAGCAEYSAHVRDRISPQSVARTVRLAVMTFAVLGGSMPRGSLS